MTSDLIEQAAELAARPTFAEIARQLSRGEAIDPQVIARTLESERRDAYDLRMAVDELKRRSVIRQQIASAPELQVRKQVLEKQIIKANSVLEAEVARHQSTCRPLQFEIEELATEIQRLTSLPAELARSCPDEQLQEQYKSYELTISRLNNEYKSAAYQLDESVNGDSSPVRVSELRRGVEEIGRRCADASRKREDLYQQLVNF